MKKNKDILIIILETIIVLLILLIGYLIINKQNLNNNKNIPSNTTTTTTINNLLDYIKSLPNKSDLNSIQPTSLLDNNIIDSNFKNIIKKYNGVDYIFNCISSGEENENVCGQINVSFNIISYEAGTKYVSSGPWDKDVYFIDDYIILIEHFESVGGNQIDVYNNSKLVYSNNYDINTFVLDEDNHLFYNPVIYNNKIYFFEKNNNKLISKYYDIIINEEKIIKQIIISE